MVSQERIVGSPEAVVIYFASITYHLQKALPINHSITAILSRHATRRSGTLQDKTAAWARRPIPYNKLDQPIIVSSLKVPPHKGTKEALCDKTKSCCTGLTCQHNNTKS